MAEPLPFFGREEELAALAERARSPGVTIVSGPPMIGKSRLLRRFVEIERARPGRVVGLFIAGEAERDVLRRTIVNAYEFWLRDAKAVERLRTVWEQQKAGLPKRVARAFGSIFGAVAEDAQLPGAKTIGTAINETIDAAITISDDLRMGGQQITPLESEEARALLGLITASEGSPVLLVIDQWDDTMSLRHDAATIKAFVRSVREWPPLHVVLHLRDPKQDGDPNSTDPSAASVTRSWVRAGHAVEIPIDRIDFDGEQESVTRTRHELLHYLQHHVPGATRMDQRALLGHIAGNPAVLDRWHGASVLERADPEALARLACNAHAYAYPEVERWLVELWRDREQSDQHRHRFRIALILACLPGSLTQSGWDAIVQCLLNDVSLSAITDLQSLGLLQEGADGTPSYGHPTRQLAARLRVLDNTEGIHAEAPKLLYHSRDAIERFVLDLVEASNIDAGLAGDQGVIARQELVVSLCPIFGPLGAGALVRSLGMATATLFRREWSDELLTRPKVSFRALGPIARDTLATGLTNAIAGRGFDFNRADSLLEELRALREAHPGDATIRDRLAWGLFNALSHSGTDFARSDGLLEELRALREAHPDDATIRDRLARGLFNASNHSSSDFARSDGLLEELGALREAHPDDATVRDRLVSGLFNALCDSGPDFVRADRLLSRLRTLQEEYPAEARVKADFARGLTNAIALTGSDFDRADGLLREMAAIDPAGFDKGVLEDSMVRAIGASMKSAIVHRNVQRAVLMAERFVPLRGALYCENSPVDSVRSVIRGAINLAIELDAEDAGRRLIAISRALFEH